MRKNELYVNGCKYGLVKDHINDFNLYNHFKNAVHFFDGTIQHTDAYGHKLYLKKDGDKWITTTETTANPYMYPNIIGANQDELVNVFLLENKRKFFAYPIGEDGKDDRLVISESSAEFFSELISFCLENQYKYLGLLDTMFKDYDPISNYDYSEKRDDTHGKETFNHIPDQNGKGSSQTTSRPAVTTTTITPDAAGTEVEHYVTTYDSDSSTRLADRTVQKGSSTTTAVAISGDGSSNTTYSSEKYKDERTQDSDGYTLERHGTNGAAQELIEQERSIRRFTILKEFCKELSNYVCLSVY